MSNLFTQVANGMAAKPFTNKPDYIGLEYKWNFLTFRPAVLREELTHEPFILAAVILYIVAFFLGKSHNAIRARKWHETTLPLLKSQFFKVAPEKLTSSGYTDFMSYATGRRTIESLHTVLALRPRHDLIQWGYQVGNGFVDLQYKPFDKLDLIFTLEPTAVPDFAFAIVNKEALRGLKDERWDLGQFTKPAVETPGLPPNTSVMFEYADVLESILKYSDTKALFAALSDPKVMEHFRSISITDQPREQPTKPIPASNKEKHIILSLIAPLPSNAPLLLPLVAAIFPWADSLSKVNLRPETKLKIKKTREDIDKEMTKEAEKEKLEEAADAKAAAKRKAEEERMSKLSAKEQQKILDQQKKRQMKKAQVKGAKKG